MSFQQYGWIQRLFYYEEKGKYQMISLFTCGILKNDTDELIYKMKYRHRKQKWLPKGKGWEG